MDTITFLLSTGVEVLLPQVTFFLAIALSLAMGVLIFTVQTLDELRQILLRERVHRIIRLAEIKAQREKEEEEDDDDDE